MSTEENNRLGDLGDSIAQALIPYDPVPMEYVAVNDMFGQSGTPAELMKKYGLDAPHIVQAVQKVLLRKKYPELNYRSAPGSFRKTKKDKYQPV